MFYPRTASLTQIFMKALFRHFGVLFGLLLVTIPSLNSLAGSAANPRERLLMDFRWKFHLGNDWGEAVNLAKAATGYGPASQSHDWLDTPTFDVKKFLHSGENTIVVAVHNRYGPGGINQGVTLRLVGKLETPQWKRSVFNGRAQIIMQSTQTPGEIKLTAQAEGFSPTLVEIQTLPWQPRPCVP